MKKPLESDCLMSAKRLFQMEAGMKEKGPAVSRLLFNSWDRQEHLSL